GDDPPPPIEDDEELERAEESTRREVTGPEREEVRRGGDTGEQHVARQRRARAREHPDRHPDHAHRDPAERARMEVREQRVGRERAEDPGRVREPEERGETEDAETDLERAVHSPICGHLMPSLLRGGSLPLPGARVQRHHLDVLGERAAREGELGGRCDVLHPELVEEPIKGAVLLVAVRVVGHRHDALPLELSGSEDSGTAPFGSIAWMISAAWVQLSSPSWPPTGTSAPSMSPSVSKSAV